MKPFALIFVALIAPMLLPAQTDAQAGLDPATLGVKEELQFIVTVRDTKTRDLIEGCKIEASNEPILGRNGTVAVRGNKSNGGGDENVDKGALTMWGAPVQRFALADGIWHLRVSADGYDTTIVDGIPGRGGISEVSDYPYYNPHIFRGTTVGIDVSLERSATGHTARRYRYFLSDTTFYGSADVPPEPVGGIEAIAENIGQDEIESKISFTGVATIRAYINKAGEVVRTDAGWFTETVIYQILSQAVMDTKFKPARILGRTVCSMIDIPFEVNAPWHASDTWLSARVRKGKYVTPEGIHILREQMSAEIRRGGVKEFRFTYTVLNEKYKIAPRTKVIFSWIEDTVRVNRAKVADSNGKVQLVVTREMSRYFSMKIPPKFHVNLIGQSVDSADVRTKAPKH